MTTAVLIAHRRHCRNVCDSLTAHRDVPQVQVDDACQGASLEQFSPTLTARAQTLAAAANGLDVS